MKKIQSVKIVLILLLVTWFIVSCEDNINDNKWNNSIDNTEPKIEQNTTLSSDEEDMVNEIFDM